MLYAQEMAWLRTRYGRSLQRRWEKARGDRRAWWSSRYYRSEPGQ